MSYKLTSATATQLTFEAPKEPSKYGGWIFVGCLVLVAVVLYLVDPHFTIVAFTIIEFFLLAISWLVMMALVFQPDGPYVTPPARIVFDRNKGGMMISSRADKNDDTLTIPFNEIAKAGLDTKTKSEKNGGEVSTHYLFVELTSGGKWYLTSTRTKEEADQWVTQLDHVVDRSIAPATRESTTLPQRWLLKSDNEQTLVTWTNPLGNRPWRLLLRAVVLTAHLVGIAYIIGIKSPVSEWAVAVGIMSPFLILIGWLATRVVRRLVRDKITQYAIRLSNAGFDYYEFAKEGGTQRHHVHLPIDNMGPIHHTFAPELMLPHDITVTQQNGDEPITVFTELTPMERQRVVDWLQQRVIELRGRQP